MKYVILLVLLLGCSFLGLNTEEEIEDNFVEDLPIPIEVKEEIVEEIPHIQTDIEGSTHINFVTVSPACIEGQNGGEIKFSLSQTSSKVRFQIREANENFMDVLEKGSRNEGSANFLICEDCLEADFYLLPDKIYAFRMAFDQTNTEYSNHHLIDTTNSSDYMTKECKSEKIIIRGW